MELNENVNIDLQVNQKVMSKFIGRFIAACVAVITTCASAMVLFVWDLKSDFATERAKTETIVNSVTEIKSDLKDTNRDVQTLKENSVRMDAKMQSFEHTMTAITELRPSR